MEEQEKGEIIDVNKFFLICSQIYSEFFQNLFKEYIHGINIQKNNNEIIYAYIDIIFSENTSNYFNIVHGGSVALLFENISHMILFYITKENYDTKDINIIYKRQILLNVKYTLKVKIEKIKYKTVFIHCNLFQTQNKFIESNEGNLIVEKKNKNKI